MANVQESYVETVGVEQSDERLAAAEEAKRSGEAFKSMPSKGTEIVPHDIAVQIAEDNGNQETYVGKNGLTYAAHLEDFHDAVSDPNFVEQSNEEKAQAHHDYSAEIARKRQEEDARNAELKAQGYRFDLAVQQANLERARESEDNANAYQAFKAEHDAGVPSVVEAEQQVLAVVHGSDLAAAPSAERAKALEGKFRVPEATEQPMRDALQVKDAIIATEEPYQKYTASYEELRAHDAPGLQVIASVGSPEELVDRTGIAQSYAANVTAEAEKDNAAVEEKLAEKEGTKTSADQRQAEEEVAGPFDLSKQMPPVPEQPAPAPDAKSDDKADAAPKSKSKKSESKPE